MSEVKMKRNENVDPSEVKYRHKRAHMLNHATQEVSISNLGGITIAYREVDAETIIYAFAVCSFKDNYCKKTGRTIAAGRLKSPKYSVTIKSSFSQFHKAVSELSDPLQLLCLVTENNK